MTNFNYALNSLGTGATSDCQQASYPAFQATDGSDDTMFRSTVGTGGSHYLKVDLGVQQYITLVRVKHTNQGDEGGILQYSHDGSTWYNVTTYAAAQNTYYLQVGGVTARYWRLYFNLTAGDGQQIQAFEIIGPIEAPPPPTSPAPDYINAWLDGLEANYVPTITDWLAAQ